MFRYSDPLPDDEQTALSRYGRTDYGTEEELRAFLNQNPLRIDAHMGLADWYQEQGNDDELAFRQAIIQSLQRRLNTPWEPYPRERFWLPHLPHGPAQPFIDTVRSSVGTHGMLGLAPGLIGNRSGDPGWIVNDYDTPRDTSRPMMSDWYKSRIAGEYPGTAPGRSKAWDTEKLYPAERLYAGIDNLKDIDPEHWPALEALMRDRFNRGEQQLSRYARTDYYGDEDFLNKINEQPLNITGHHVYADWLSEQGRPDEEAFRRAVAESVQRRLSNPWLDLTPVARDFHYLPLVPQGPVVPLRDSHQSLEPWRNPNPHSIAPAAITSPGRVHWGWSYLSEDPGPNPNPLQWNEWNDRRLAGTHPGTAPGRPPGPGGSSGMLFPAERIYGGIDNLENIDPSIWPQVEAMMRDRYFNFGEQQLSRYEQDPAGVEQVLRYGRDAYDQHIAYGIDPESPVMVELRHYLERLGDVGEVLRSGQIPYAFEPRKFQKIVHRIQPNSDTAWVHQYVPEDNFGDLGWNEVDAEQVPIDQIPILHPTSRPLHEVWPDAGNYAPTFGPNLTPEEIDQIFNQALGGNDLDWRPDQDTLPEDFYAMSRYAQDPTAYGTEDELRAYLNQRPLDVSAHLGLSDWYQEQGREREAAFRRAVAESLQRRLSNPWQDPAGPYDVVNPDFFSARQHLPHLPHGPARPLGDVARRAGGNSVLHFVPGRLDPETSNVPDWQWLIAAETPPDPDDGYMPTNRELISARQKGTYPGTARQPVSSPFFANPGLLQPAERIYAGIDDLEQMDPAIWPQLEAMMRDRYFHRHHQSLSRYSDQPTNYGTEEALIAHINQNPLDWGAHGGYADWLNDNDRYEDEAFRRQVMDWAYNKSTVPWQPPTHWMNHAGEALSMPGSVIDRTDRTLNLFQGNIEHGEDGPYWLNFLAPHQDPNGDDWRWWLIPPYSPTTADGDRLREHLGMPGASLPEMARWELGQHSGGRLLNLPERVMTNIANPYDMAESGRFKGEPTLWPQVEALLRQRFNRKQRLSRYGRTDYYGDEDFLAKINEQPLNVTGHHVYADWLQEQNRPDEEAFRRAVAGSVERRLSNPWTPQSDEMRPGRITQHLPVVEHGPLVGMYDPILDRPDKRDRWLMGPGRGIVNDEWSPWAWFAHRHGWSTEEERLQLPTWQTWSQRRNAGQFPGADPEFVPHPDSPFHDLHPAERVYAGIDNLENIDPRIWPQVEALMRDRYFNRNEQHLSRFS